MSYRNKYLFPLIKEGQVYDKNDIVLDENKAKTYLECLAMTMDKSSDVYMAEVPSLDSKKDFISSKLNKDYNIIIKKSTWNSTESDNDSESGSKYKSLKITKQKEDYVDQYEVDYLNKLKNEARPGEAKKINKKWYGKACDLLRAIENHKKSGIFYEPYVPSDVDSQSNKPGFKANSKVKYPITLKTISIQFKLGLYNSMEELKKDLVWMFNNTKNYLSNKKLLDDLKAITQLIY